MFQTIDNVKRILPDLAVIFLSGISPLTLSLPSLNFTHVHTYRSHMKRIRHYTALTDQLTPVFFNLFFEMEYLQRFCLFTAPIGVPRNLSSGHREIQGRRPRARNRFLERGTAC